MIENVREILNQKNKIKAAVAAGAIAVGAGSLAYATSSHEASDRLPNQLASYRLKPESVRAVGAFLYRGAVTADQESKFFSGLEQAKFYAGILADQQAKFYAGVAAQEAANNAAIAAQESRPAISSAPTSTSQPATTPNYSSNSSSGGGDVGAWQRVAQCEEGGADNPTFGYYGITPGSWAAYGGTAYAPTAGGASQYDQVIIAERISGGYVPDANGCGSW